MHGPLSFWERARVRVKLGAGQLLLSSLLSWLFLLAIGWQPAPTNEEGAPPGCEAVFAATSRGGSKASIGGGGCNIFRGDGRTRRSVIRVVDGDTILVSGRQRVRYLGIDTPEVGDAAEHFGPEATDFNERLVEGRTVYLERDVSDKDRFGRLLRFVYADGILVNADLVREGYARAVVYPPDTRYAECFAALEREAIEAHRGMWSEGDAGSE